MKIKMNETHIPAVAAAHHVNNVIQFIYKQEVIAYKIFSIVLITFITIF